MSGVPTIVQALAIAPYRAAVRFTDGRERIVDLDAVLHGPLEPVRDPERFLMLRCAYGTITWPGGYDVSPYTIEAQSIPGSEAEANVILSSVAKTSDRPPAPTDIDVPIVAFFHGLIITMYWFDDRQHHRPHFHVRYAEYTAVVDIGSGDLLAGDLPRAQQRLVAAWVELHRLELMANWDLVRAGLPPERIAPLY